MSKIKLLDQVRDAIRVKHFSIRTEQAYVHWIRQFILFNGKRHPLELAESEVSNFLSYLAVAKKVSSSTQNQALCAVLFLYRHVLRKELGWLDDVERAKRPARLPVVFSRNEVKKILSQLEGTKWLIVSTLYGCGLRLMECLRLRVKDLDFDYDQVIVRNGKGDKDRVTMMPTLLKEPFESHLRKVKLIHEEDLKAGFGRVNLPFALKKKYPNADRE